MLYMLKLWQLCNPGQACYLRSCCSMVSIDRTSLDPHPWDSVGRSPPPAMQHTLVHSTCLHHWPCDLSSFPSYLQRGTVLTSVAWA